MEEKTKELVKLEQQITFLRSRGMRIDDSMAVQWLKNVSYYRLSGYWYPYQVLVNPSRSEDLQRLDVFEPGTSFSQVVALYEFDRKLRTLIHDGMERIEVALRARIGDLLMEKVPLSYNDRSLFRPEFNHEGWLSTARKRVERAGRKDSSLSYINSCSECSFYKLSEVLDFSDVSRLLDGLKLDDQRMISEGLGFIVDVEKLNARQKGSFYRQDPLARWCEQFTVLRNICAHHGRLWNRYLTPASTNSFRKIEALSSLPKGQSSRVYGALVVMSFMLRTISPGTSWPEKVCRLIEVEYLGISGRALEEMGFPNHFQTVAI